MNTIIFGTPEANELLKADKAIIERTEAQSDLRDLEYEDLRRQRRQLMRDLDWAKIQGFDDEAQAIEWQLQYIQQELEQYPSPSEERAALQRWNEWASGNPAAVSVYVPGQTWCYRP